MKTLRSIFLLAFSAAALIACSACKTDTGDPTKDRNGRVTNAVLEEAGSFVERVAFSTLTNSANDLATGQKVDLAHAAAAGVWANAGSIVSSDGIKHIADAWSGKQLTPIATAAAQAYAKADPQTPADKVAVVNRIAQGISNAAMSTALP